MNLRPYYHQSLYAQISAPETRSSVIAYLVAGALVSGSDYGTFTLVTLLKGNLLAATVVAYVVGLVVSYFLNRYWVFRKHAAEQSTATNLWRYSLFLLVNLAITYAMLLAMQQWFGISPFIGKFIVNTFMIVWIYAGDKYWVFKGEDMGPIKL